MIARRDSKWVVKTESQNKQATMNCSRLSVLILILLRMFCAGATAQKTSSPENLELSRVVRSSGQLIAVGQKAGVFGYESGRFEAWVYPLKIMRDFELTFRADGRDIPADLIARTIETRPESTTVVYTYDQFSVRETIAVPVKEPGVIVRLDINTYTPLEITASFTRDFQLMWPAGLGGTFASWDAGLDAFVIGEERRRFYGIIGSPHSSLIVQDYVTDYGTSNRESFRLEPAAKGYVTRYLVIAGSIQGRPDAEDTYKRLLANAKTSESESAAYYRNYLRSTTSIEIPDKAIQQAYNWARVSVAQGIVQSPLLGTGLVAGYRISGDTARPGFAWFFGRDSEWTDLALTADGDYENTRQALEFIMKFQREDGKVPHEISQTASLVDWFQNYPYGFASADATPLLIVAAEDYVTQSGDILFARQNWDHFWRAYQFVVSTYDEEGFAKNQDVGHGWVEGGPLLPVRSELYQAALAVQALRSLGRLAAVLGKEQVAHDLEEEFKTKTIALNRRFWVADKNIYGFGLDAGGKPVPVASVLATVPAWMGLLDADKANQMINVLAGEDHSTDWGMRLVSSTYEKFDPSGYHFGAVWPLFTGWAAVGEYKYHRPLAAFQNLRANALLTLNGGSLGHTTEVLSGSYFEDQSLSSLHQIWSAAMVISPILRGMMGLSNDAPANTLTFAPHLPADWSFTELHNVKVRGGFIDLSYSRSDDEIRLETTPTSSVQTILEFSPAISSRAQIVEVQNNGRRIPFKVTASSNDQHIEVRVPMVVHNDLRIRLRHDFGLAFPVELPELGGPSRNIKVVTETWNSDHSDITYDLQGIEQYTVLVRGGEEIDSVDGAQAVKNQDGKIIGLQVSFSTDAANTQYSTRRVSIHFAASIRIKTTRPAKAGTLVPMQSN